MKAGGPLWALGCMSGTSMDGVDAALIRTDGVEIFEFGESWYRPYTAAERAALVAAQGRWPGDAGVGAAEALVRGAHLEVLADAGAPDVVGFHGQTLAHEPRGRGTHQVGDGDRLAGESGRCVVWDFRASDVALGGEGAPLAPFFHFACARWIGARAPVAFLNLGGVANVTWVDPTAARPEEAGALLAFDTGPANALIDDLVRARTGQGFDRDGAFAAAGRVDLEMVGEMLEDPYFFRVPPKSLDRNYLSRLGARAAKLSTPDACATLAACTVAAVAHGVAHFPSAPERLLVAGGGRKNLHIMNELKEQLTVEVLPVESVGLDGDMLEAQAFGYLAVRVLRGMATSAPGTTGVAASVGGGRISRPGGG